ncbi:MAG TPA: redoxin domain-containing protein [Candidatus Sulfotelmatobacter sp.]|nr:redoxin domain-containing protein [Candidatus Sulfotelmatobacter sp.]
MTRLVRFAFPAVLALAALAPGSAAPLPGPVVGQPAPNFSLTTIDGKHVRLSDYRGRTLVINVWGSWCPPCRLETPDLVAEAKAQARHGVAFLGVDTTESPSVVRAFSIAKAIPYPQVATSGTSAFARDYAIRNYPTTFVIDPSGVLRARHADNLLPRPQLHAYIVAAQHGATAPLKTAFQTQLDAMLAPARYTFTGDPATVLANVQQAVSAIGKVDDLLDDAMDDPSRDHDLIATQQEEETLRAAAIAALTPIATGDPQLALLARLHGDEDAALGKWSDAKSAYEDALTKVPNDLDALSGLADAEGQLGDAARVVALDQQIAQLHPTRATYVALARAQIKTGDVAGGEASFAHAIELAAAEPPPNAAQIAWTALYAGQAEADLGRAASARAFFARALVEAERVAPTDPRREWYIERAQEGTVALGVVPGAAPALSLAPWTGPDLPGSLASTIKYRLVVTGKPGTAVDLATQGLPKRWIGSFCTDRVCSPFRVSVVVPPVGAKIIEFQVVPQSAVHAPPTVSIQASVGNRPVARVGTTVRT